MKRKTGSVYVVVSSVAILLLVAPFMVKPSAADNPKLKAEEIIARHVESLGGAELLGTISSYVIKGTCKYTFKSGVTGQAEGNVVLVSEGNKSLIAMEFGGTDYPAERVAFDGSQISTSYLRPAARTPLGSFVLLEQAIVKEGLLGGALSSTWPFRKVSDKNAKLESGGTKKVDNRPAYAVRYKPRGGSDFSMTLLFDAETFQHVRTDYDRLVSAQIGRGGVDSSASVRSSRYVMSEQFSDFRKESGLMVPHVYKITTRVETPQGSQQSEWTLTLTEFSFNQPIEAGIFKIN